MSQNDREWVKAAISNTGRLVVVTAMPMAAGIALISNDIVSLFGGDSFDQASMLVCILAAHIPLAALGTVLGAGLWALDRQRAWAVTAWCAVALNIGGNAIAIPVASAVAGQPAAGAALVTIATEAFMLARAWALIGEAVDRPMLLRAGTGAGFSCAIMAVIVLSLPPGAPLAAIVAIGAATYAVAILASRTVQFSDARFVARAIAQRQVSAQAA
jgi:O-antigen/teichoic acid export membrane protein